jgi:putative ABC transport system permease protein
METVRLTVRSAWARKRRLAGTVSAVLLGVAFLSGTLVLGDTARAGFADVFAAANAGTDVVVRSEDRLESETGTQSGLLDASIVASVAAVDGVDAAAGGIEANAQVVGSDGRPLGGDGPPTMAGSWIDDPELFPFELAEGRAPSAAGEVVLDRRTAEAGDLAVGDATTVLTPAPIDVTVVGVATFGGEDGMAGATFVAFTPAEAAEVLLGDPAAITQVYAAGEPGVGQAELASRIGAALPARIEAITARELADERQAGVEDDFLGFMETFLLVFAGVALLVATSSVHNTAAILVAQRTRESALLRAVGASRGQVLAATLLEAVLVGVVGAAAGAAAGIGLAAGLAALLSAGDIGLPADELVVSAGAMAWSVGVGVGLSVLASVVPACKASRVPPVAAMREVAVEDGRPSRWRAVAGVGLTVVGVATVLDAADTDDALASAGLGALGVVAGVILLGPVVARRASRVLGAPLAARGVTGRLARGGAERNPRRTAGTASALLVGVGVVTTFTVLADSLSSSIEDAVDRSFAGDLVVESAGFSGAGLDPALTVELVDLPEVEAAAALGDGIVLAEGDELDVVVTDAAAFAQVASIDVADGDLAAVGDGAIAVSSAFADERGWSLGTAVPIRFTDGAEVDLRVGAVYEDRTMVGDVLLPDVTWAAHAVQPTTFAVLVGLADGVALDDGRAAVEATAARYGSPDVFDEDEFVASAAGEIDQVLGVIYGLLVLAILIAGLGIAGTLSLSIHERTRELGLLRAVGLDRRQLRRIVRGEAVIVALLGTLGGLGVGTFVGWGLVRAFDASEGMGTFSVPGGSLAVVVVLGALVGVVAAARPARRAARMPVLDALSAS